MSWGGVGYHTWSSITHVTWSANSPIAAPHRRKKKTTKQKAKTHSWATSNRARKSSQPRGGIEPVPGDSQKPRWLPPKLTVLWKLRARRTNQRPPFASPDPAKLCRHVIAVALPSALHMRRRFTPWANAGSFVKSALLGVTWQKKKKSMIGPTNT